LSKSNATLLLLLLLMLMLRRSANSQAPVATTNDRASNRSSCRLLRVLTRRDANTREERLKQSNVIWIVTDSSRATGSIALKATNGNASRTTHWVSTTNQKSTGCH
jgi:hypothetical protein